MKKTLILSALLCAALLAGCAPQPAVEAPSPTPVETAPASEAPTADPTAEPETEVEFEVENLFHLSDPSVPAISPTLMTSDEERARVFFGEPKEGHYLFGMTTGRYYFQGGWFAAQLQKKTEADWKPNSWLWLEAEGDGVKVKRVLLGRDGFTVEVSAYTAPGEEPATTWGILLALNLEELPPAETPITVRVTRNETLRDLEFRAEEKVVSYSGLDDIPSLGNILYIVRSVSELPDDLTSKEQFNEEFFQTHSLLCMQFMHGYKLPGKRIERVRIAKDGTVFIHLVMNQPELDFVEDMIACYSTGYAIIVEKLPENARAILLGENRPQSSDLTMADMRAYYLELYGLDEDNEE